MRVRPILYNLLYDKKGGLLSSDSGVWLGHRDV